MDSRLELVSEPKNKKIRDYTLIERIGGGGMSRIYHAQDSSNQDVCLKEFRFGVYEGEESAFTLHDLFQREAETLSKLNHPQIPNFVDYFNTQRNGEIRHYLAMEYVSGKNL